MPNPPSRKNGISAAQKPWLVNLLILAIYTALTLFMTWPVAAHFATELAGARSDLWTHQWTFWWVKEALQTGQDPFFTTQLYYPLGVSLTSHNIAWLNIAAWLPLQAVLGSVAAYNLTILAIFTLNAFCFYLFARELTTSPTASFVGGVVFGFWPYTMSHYDHPNMIILFWVPLTLLFMQRTYQRQSLPYALLSGVSLAMIGFSRWQLLVMSAPLLGIYLAYLTIRDPSGRTGRSLGLFALSGLLALLLMAPLAAPLVRDQLSRESVEEVDVIEYEGVTDILAYFIPEKVYNAFWRDVTFRLPHEYPYQNIAASFNYVPYLGYLTLLLAIYGAVRRLSKAWIWLVLGLFYFLLALGPTLTVDAHAIAGVPMPYRLLSGSLIDVLIRRPHRLNLFLSLPVAMLVTWAVVDLMRLVEQRYARRWPGAPVMLGLFLAMMILIENPVRPFPTTSTEIPAWYEEVAGEPGEFGLLELPTYERGFDKLYMFYQTQHGKPIAGGHVSRLPAGYDSFRESIPFLEPMLRQDTWLVQPEEWVDFALVDVTRQFRPLAQANIRYIVISKTLLPEGLVERWRDWATMRPAYEDDEVLVYRTAPEVGVDFAVNEPLAEGIGLFRSAYVPLTANQGGTIKIDARWASEGAPSADYRACFALADANDVEVETSCMVIAPDLATSTWQPNELVRGSYVLPLSRDVAVGDYTLSIYLSEDGRQPVGETVSLGPVAVQPFNPEHRNAVCFEDEICLEGYDIAQQDGRLALITFWQAAQPLESSYKLFIHLVDPATGEVIAQSDAIPRDWSYPTDIWEAGEIVRDAAALPLENVPPGDYVVRLGWYAVEGGQRLRACADEACDEQSPQVYRLTEIEIVDEQQP